MSYTDDVPIVSRTPNANLWLNKRLFAGYIRSRSQGLLSVLLARKSCSCRESIDTVVDEGMRTSTYFDHAQWVQNRANLLPVVVVVREVAFKIPISSKPLHVYFPCSSILFLVFFFLFINELTNMFGRNKFVRIFMCSK